MEGLRGDLWTNVVVSQSFVQVRTFKFLSNELSVQTGYYRGGAHAVRGDGDSLNSVFNMRDQATLIISAEVLPALAELDTLGEACLQATSTRHISWFSQKET